MRARRAAGILPDLSPLRESDSYRAMFLGQVSSQLGTQLRQVALPYQIYLLTQSSFQVGLIGLFQLVPILLVTLAGGVLADRYDRRRLLLITQSSALVIGAIIALLTQVGAITVGILYALTAVSAAFGAIDHPVRGSLMPTLVPRRMLAAAVTLNYSLFQIGAIAGPAIAGVAIAAFGISSAYWLSCLGLAGSIAGILGVTAPPQARAARTTALVAVSEGLRYVWGSAVLRSALAIDVLALAFASPLALLPYYADRVYGVGPEGVGLLFAAPAAGSLLAVLTSGWVSRIRRQGYAVVVAVVAWGLGIAAFGLATAFPAGLALLAFAFGADSVSAIIRNTVLQSVVRDEMRGRLTSIYSLAVNSGPLMGQVRAGGVGTLVSPEFAMVSGGLAAVASAAAFALWSPLGGYVVDPAARAEERPPA
ncbi:MAG: MFS transporter [Chloroflexi bacterium]|nr:MFS transporter [Chloroflexota bacterium]